MEPARSAEEKLFCTACQRSHRSRRHVNAKIAGAEALTARGEPRVYHTADELEDIGMPIGGISPAPRRALAWIA